MERVRHQRVLIKRPFQLKDNNLEIRKARFLARLYVTAHVGSRLLMVRLGVRWMLMAFVVETSHAEAEFPSVLVLCGAKPTSPGQWLKE